MDKQPTKPPTDTRATAPEKKPPMKGDVDSAKDNLSKPISGQKKPGEKA